MRILSISIGGVYVRWGVLDKDYNFIDRGKFKSNIFEGEPKKVIRKVIDKLIPILEEYKEIKGISVQFHGVVNELGSIIDPPKTLKHYKWLNLYDEFTKRIPNKKIKVFSNATALMENEIYFGKLKNVDMGMLINISSSIEGGITYKGEVLKGPLGVAGQFGKQNIGGEQWELSVGSWSLLSKIMLMTSDTSATTSDIPEVVANNDMLASVYDRWYYDLAYGVYNLIVCFNPEKIVISGGITNNRFFSLEPLVRHLYKLAIDDLMERTVIEVSDFKETGSIIGGAICFKKQ